MESPNPNAGTLAGRAGRHLRWYQLYYLLAALDVVTVLVCLTLNHLLVENYVESVAESQRWASREDDYALLSEQARAVNAPGNDVFDSRDVAAESARMHASLGDFNAQLEKSREEIARNVSASEARPLLEAFDEIEQAMRVMVAEAEQVFAFFEAREVSRAGERMATMDRKYAAVSRALARLSSVVQGIEQSHLEKQLAEAKVLRRMEYLIVGLMVLMIAGALYYGSRIYRAMRAADAERAQHIEELTLARAEADAASKAKSDFLAVMSHEIRTPLNTVFLTLDMLEDPRPGDERQNYIAVARSSVRSLKRLIDDVLTLSRIESGKFELESVAFDLRGYLTGLLSPHAHAAAAKGVRLAIAVGPEVPRMVRTDPTRFGEIVANLVDNAVKFTDAGSIEVSVALRPQTPPDPATPEPGTVTLHIEVRDTGIGIPAGQKARIFEDFVQAEVSTSRTHGGTGLGLSIARRLVELMKGSLGVHPTPGGGSTFWLDLDFAASDQGPLAGPPQGERASWEGAFAGRRVLLVEDSPESRALTTAVLSRMGVSVDAANNGPDAITAAAATAYDAILMDIAMPGMDGFEATRRIREREGDGEEVPIIALTAQVTDGIFQKCLDAGMDDHLAKPATRDAMGEALRRWLRPFKAEQLSGAAHSPANP